MANFNLNKVILGGRLTADPELKTTPSGVSVTTFTMAINRRYTAKDGQATESDFLNVTAWRGVAEFITKFFRKGSSICIMGSIHSRTWTDQQGQKRYATEVIAEEAYFVDSKSDGSGKTTVDYNAGVKVSVSDAPEFEPLGDGEELPF